LTMRTRSLDVYRGHRPRVCIPHYVAACAHEPERAARPFDPSEYGTVADTVQGLLAGLGRLRFLNACRRHRC
jgi:hypothetical protein